jgi:hypothetical protein
VKVSLRSRVTSSEKGLRNADLERESKSLNDNMKSYNL